jgi:hypothetical protein
VQSERLTHVPECATAAVESRPPGHSLADSLNQVLLWISLRRSGVPADPLPPFGHGREGFLWAFLATIAVKLIREGLLAIWPLS